MTTAMVTGCAGFIGSHLTDRLLDDGYRVIGIDNLSHGSEDNLFPMKSAKKAMFRFLREDIRNVGILTEAMSSVDVVFHLAALGSVPRSISRPAETNEVNVGGTLNVLIAAKTAKVRRVVFSSSSSVYGGVYGSKPVSESWSVHPKSPYAVSKMAGEYYCHAFGSVYSLGTVCLRYFNVYGPRQNPEGPYAAVVPNFITALKKGDTPVIYGDGHQTRSFAYVSDVVDATVKAANADVVSGTSYNIAGNEQVSINQLFSAVCKAMEIGARPEYVDARVGDVRHSGADISNAKAELMYEPQVLLEEGIAKTVVEHTQ